MGPMDRMNMDRHPGMRFSRSQIASVSGPRYHADEQGRTVTMHISLFGMPEKRLGDLVIRMEFDFLLKDILALGWWQSDMACIVDEAGAYMAHTNMAMTDRRTLGGSDDPLERAIFERMKSQPFGTVALKGHPPDLVAGFYKLDQVPWTIIMFAEGHKILGPIVTYRNGIALGVFVLAALVLVLIRFHMCRMVRQIQQLSEKAQAVAEGDYGSPIPVESRDELGQLVESFNTMVKGLEERDHIRNSFGRYVDPDLPNPDGASGGRPAGRRPSGSGHAHVGYPGIHQFVGDAGARSDRGGSEPVFFPYDRNHPEPPGHNRGFLWRCHPGLF